AGGDVDGGHGIVGPDAEADHGRWRRSRCQQDAQPIAGQNFGGGGREVFRREAAIVADDDGLAALADGIQIAGIALGGSPQIGVGVVIADASTPAVGTELDVAHSAVLSWFGSEAERQQYSSSQDWVATSQSNGR